MMMMSRLILAALLVLATNISNHNVAAATEEDVSTCMVPSCFNLTVFGPWHAEKGPDFGPYDPWAGSVCMYMQQPEMLEVTFETSGYWDMWETHLWLSADGSTMPVDDEDMPDLTNFPYTNESMAGVGSWSYTIPLNSNDACAGGQDSYTFTTVNHAIVGENCVPYNAKYTFGTDWDAWGRDVDDLHQSSNSVYTSYNVTVQCNCEAPGTDAPEDSTVRKAPPSFPDGTGTPPLPDGTSPPKSTPPKDGGNGGAFGDPHIQTWTGEHYEYHGTCDLVLLHNPGFAHGLGMDVHIRTKKIQSWSYIDIAAVHIGDDTLEVKGGDNSNDYWINGMQGRDLPGPGKVGNGVLPETLGGHAIVYRRLRGGRRRFIVELGNGEQIIIKTFKNFVRVNVRAIQLESFSTAVGLMGSYPSGLKLARDNTTLLEHSLNDFGQEWQVRADEPVLFHERDGPQPPELCKVPTVSRRLGESSITLNEAEIACGRVIEADRDACIFDVMATEDKDMAGVYSN